ncbi:hypothetical protein FKV24_012630 [Lysobacter maris]|uniref:Uncharacterized protein n=1 Tax=Marilutibacter maris TaxID=1605891 RepID=A0A508AKB8_9GAMM|nr:hypothetical protein [Lysobacter maris]KAB8180175.1 hypothetical protein FKV24_012630 [Lysobacter maris]
MRIDRSRRLKRLESNVVRDKSSSEHVEQFIAWLSEQHQHHVDWDLHERLAQAPYAERVGVIVDFMEAVEAKDPDAMGEINRRLDGDRHE